MCRAEREDQINRNFFTLLFEIVNMQFTLLFEMIDQPTSPFFQRQDFPECLIIYNFRLILNVPTPVAVNPDGDDIVL